MFCWVGHVIPIDTPRAVRLLFCSPCFLTWTTSTFFAEASSRGARASSLPLSLFLTREPRPPRACAARRCSHRRASFVRVVSPCARRRALPGRGRSRRFVPERWLGVVRVGMRSESMIRSMRGVLHQRYVCYLHERDANPLVVTANQIEVVQNDVIPICYHERISGSI